MSALSIRHMHFTQRYLEQIREEEDKLQYDIGCAMDALRELDPDGWEKWYDGTIPDDATYEQILKLISTHNHELTLARH